MQSIKELSPYQFAVFRISFGLYLLIHFLSLIPYGKEMFSNQGLLPNPRLNFTYGIFPNLLSIYDSPWLITLVLLILVIFSFLYTTGVYRRVAAIGLWYGWACLFHRNNLISNPSIPYVGLLLLLSAIIPTNEPFVLIRNRDNFSKGWCLPKWTFVAAWVLLATGYTFSGCIKLMSPSWIDGTAMLHVVNNPLARPNIFREFFLSLPDWLVKLSSWTPLAMEILFLPMCYHRITRMIAWVSMVCMHVGILLVVNFADLSLGMLMIHAFTFDPDWFPTRKRNKGTLLVLYDGECGLCDQSVQFLLNEDKKKILLFAPLQGETAQTILNRHKKTQIQFQTIVLVTDFKTDQEKLEYRSCALLGILNEIGGFWRIVSWMRIIPSNLRDAVYSVIARNRYRWFGRFEACMIPSSEFQGQFLP